MHSRSVGQVLGPLVADLRGLLGDDLVGLYLYGSAVTGDFDEGVSDVDLVAVTSSEVVALDTGGLERIHEAFVLGNDVWRDRLEIVYVARRTLANMAAGDSLAVISPGEPFHITGPAGDWLQNWYLLRETGVALAGPSPKCVVAPISTAEFLRGVKSYLGYLAAVEPSPYSVLSACRAARTLRTGHHCSKLAGAQWVSELMPEWSALIESAVEGRLARAGFADPATQHSARRLVELLAAQFG